MTSSTTFKFAWLVDLLEDLDASKVAKALPASRALNPEHQIIKQWFSRNNSKIQRQGQSASAFLSCMFPERLPQRSYAMQETRLAGIFGRALGLGSTRARTLNSWRDNGDKEFACCVEAVIAECESDPPSPARHVTLEEIDATLTQIAANSAFSSPELRARKNNKKTDELLAPILRRLSSREAKWFVRMIRKSYSPVQIPEQTAMLEFHFLLPSILAVQNSLDAALEILGQPNVAMLPLKPDKDLANAWKKTAGEHLVPRLATMVTRPAYEKARSIKHCCQIADKRLMSVERKYDGEYCQIHVDRSKGSQCIQIFSKSGKDSTEDRVRLQGPIKDGLSLDRPGCKIKQKCILEGELLVWNRTTATIQPFHKIRRHVMHGGRFIGTRAESQAAVDEHVMIVFYDILLLDDKVLARLPHRQRRKDLKSIVKRIPSVSDVVEREMINFGSRQADRLLREAFAKSISNQWEGFVLKGSDDPYYSLTFGRRSIKLKKDYIGALGDVADLCIVGGRRDPNLIDRFGLGAVRWTTFYLASLDNKAEVVRFGGRPRYKIIDTVDPHGIPRKDILDLNKDGEFLSLPFAPEVTEPVVECIVPGMIPPSDLFKTAIVVEVMGAGFDKNSNCDFYTVRFPRITKIHLGRDPEAAMTLAELQEMAKATIRTAPDADSQEDAEWIERLIRADGKTQHVNNESQDTSPGKTARSTTTTSVSPASNRRSKAPVLIRIDTQELSQEDLLARKHGSPTPFSVPTPSSIQTIKTKRKRLDVETMPAPTVGAASKRRRVQSVQRSSGAILSSQELQAQNASSGRSLGLRLARNMKDLQRMPPNASASSSRSGEPAIAREALSEMTNTSPELMRRSLQQRGVLVEPPGSSSNGSRKVDDSFLRPMITATTVRSNANVPELQSCLTPPTSSAESAATDVSKSAQTKTVFTIPQLAPLATTEPEVVHRLLEDSSAPLTGTLFLTKSLTRREMQAGGTQRLHELLRESELSFTYSSLCFFKDVMRDPGRLHIALVDAEESKAVARDILDLGRAVVSHPSIDALRDRAILLVADLLFLEQFRWGSGQRTIRDGLRNLFCAGLELGPGVLDNKGARAARVVWDLTRLGLGSPGGTG